MYKKFCLIIVKGDETSFLEYIIGVHQGDNLAPLLFVLIFQGCMESLDAIRGDLLPPLPFKFFSDTKKGSPKGRLTGQRPASGTDFLFSKSIYVDDKALLAASRHQAEEDTLFLRSHLLRWGLTMHTGTPTKRSKTEFTHFPAKGKISRPEDNYDLVLSDGSLISSCTKFTYLGSIFTQDLTDDCDIQNRLNKANSAFGSMRALIFSNPYVPVPLKCSLYKSIVVNLLLWGCECWALRKEFENKLAVFHTKCCRAILGISMWEVAMFRVTNENVLRRVGIPPMEEIMHYRRLKWMEKIARMPVDRLPRKFLTAWTVSPDGTSRPHGRRALTTRDSFLSSLRHIGIESKDGNVQDWLPLAQDRKYRSEWSESIEQLLQVEKCTQHIEYLEAFVQGFLYVRSDSLHLEY